MDKYTEYIQKIMNFSQKSNTQEVIFSNFSPKILMDNASDASLQIIFSAFHQSPVFPTLNFVKTLSNQHNTSLALRVVP